MPAWPATNSGKECESVVHRMFCIRFGCWLAGAAAVQRPAFLLALSPFRSHLLPRVQRASIAGGELWRRNGIRNGRSLASLASVSFVVSMPIRRLRERLAVPAPSKGKEVYIRTARGWGCWLIACWQAVVRSLVVRRGL